MREQDKNQLRSRVAERLGLASAARVQLAVLPAMDRHIEPVPAERKAELAANIEDAFHARRDRSKAPQSPTWIDDASVAALCTTCRGACCKDGEDHAFLTRAVLSRVKAKQRLATDAALLQRYLDRVPKTAYANSCIYHGAQGCALPRSMRSETCNRYLCHPVKQLERNFSATGFAQLAVSPMEHAEDRTLLLCDGEARRVRPSRWKRR